MYYQQTYSDPKQLKRDIRGVVLCILAFLLTMSVVSSIVIVVVLFLEHGDLLMEMFGSGAATMDPNTIDEYTDLVIETSYRYSGLASIVGMLCGIPWFFLLRGKRFLTTDATQVHSKINIPALLMLFVLIMGAQFFMTLVELVLEPLFNQADTSLTDNFEQSIMGLATSPWGILYIVLVGPICEELVFRGAVMRQLERYGANFAIVMSAIFFGLYHMILFQAVFAFIIGLVLAYTAGRFSLKWAIVLHIANNSLAVLSIVLNSDVFNMALNVIYLLSMVASIIFLIVGRKYLRAQKIAGAPTEPRVFARAFSSPWFIIYAVICLSVGFFSLGSF